MGHGGKGVNASTERVVETIEFEFEFRQQLEPKGDIGLPEAVYSSLREELLGGVWD